jgi:hypothetical protein
MLELLNSLRALIATVCLPIGVILITRANEVKWGLIFLGISALGIITACI